MDQSSTPNISLDKFPQAIQLLLDRIEHLQQTVDELKSLAPKPEPQDRFLTVIQVAKFLNKERQTIYGLVHRNQIPHMGKGKNLRFSENDIKNWVKTG